MEAFTCNCFPLKCKTMDKINWWIWFNLVHPHRRTESSDSKRMFKKINKIIRGSTLWLVWYRNRSCMCYPRALSETLENLHFKNFTKLFEGKMTLINLDENYFFTFTAENHTFVFICKSLRCAFYFEHSHNRIWPMMMRGER